MSVTLAAWTVVVGGVVLPFDAPPDSDLPAGVQILASPTEYGPSAAGLPGQAAPAPSPVAPRGSGPAPGRGGPPPGYGQPPPGHGQPQQGYGQPPPGYGQAPDGAGPVPRGPRPVPRQGAAQPVVEQQRVMPLAPTSAEAGAAIYPWGLPTSSEPFDIERMRSMRATAGRLGYSAGMRGSRAYSGRRSEPPVYRKYSSVGPREPRSSAPGTSRGAAYVPRAAAEKPFSNYRPDQPLSPYMELFRRDTLDTTDNYNALVRPLLNQQRTNRRMGGAVRGLQGTVRRQGGAIRTLGRQTGASAPGNYMNYGGYYPSLGR